MHPVDDRLHALPSGCHVAEQPPRRVAEPVGLAVPAGEREVERRVGQVGDRGLSRRFVDLVDAAIDLDLGLVADARAPGPEDEPLARVAVHIACTRGASVGGQVSTPALLSDAHRVPARLHLEDEGDRPLEVMEKFTAHAKPSTARGGVDHDPHCTADSARVNRP